MNPAIWGIGTYLLITLGIGYWVSRTIKNDDDYLLGGRSFGYPLVIFSVFATWFGAETCVSSAAAVYESGLSGSSVEPVGYAFCILFMGAVFAIPLHKRGLTTLGDLFEQRFSKRTATVAVILMIPTSLIWAAAQIMAFGQVLSVNTGWGLAESISAATLVIVIYTAMGGLRADAITDLIQGILLIIGLAIVFMSVIQASGGFQESLDKVDPSRMNFFAFEEGTGWLGALEMWAIPICGSVIAQELIARVLAARNASVARNGTILGGMLYLLIGLMPVYLGLVGGQLLETVDDPEQLVPRLAQEYLPSFLYIVFTGALLSAILSTVDSALLACGALLSHNIIRPMNKNLSTKTSLLLTRAAVVACGLIAYLVALDAEKIYELIEMASSFGTSGIFVIMVMGLFSKIGDNRAAIATMGIGLLSYVTAEFIMTDFPYSFITSLGCSIITYLALSSIRTHQKNSGTGGKLQES